MKTVYLRLKTLKAITLFVMFGLLLVGACGSHKSMYEKGNYYEAVMRSVEKLRKSPNNKSARETLASAYPAAINYYNDQLDNHEVSSDPFKYSKQAEIYQTLNGMYEHVQKSPAAMQVVKARKYYQALDRVTPYAAEEQYLAGESHLALRTREDAKIAFRYFQKADQYVPGFREVGLKLDQAYQMSILHVVANLRPVQSRYYALSAEDFYRHVQNTLNQIEQNEFIRFYTPEEAEAQNLNAPDQILEINFEDFVVGETHTQERVEKMERDSVKVGSVELDRGGSKDVYGTVKADVVVNRMQVVSKGLISLNISRAGLDNKDILYQEFPGQFIWAHEWGHFNGDERALTDEQHEIVARRQIQPIPPQQMFFEFTRPIQHQLNNRLLSFYRDY